MTQIFIFGSSSAYGVGGEHGGWADMLKQHLHKTMYQNGGTGETTEIYNFAQPGATIEFVRNSFASLLNIYRQDEPTVIILSIGVNNAKLIDTGNGYVTSEDDFRILMKDLLTRIQNVAADRFIVLGYQPCDETTLKPRLNPQTGITSYFRNERVSLFNNILKTLCAEKNILYAKVAMTDDEWIADCL
jgi:lysophospholipase L1-like esterase